jgi:hypothetical protein
MKTALAFLFYAAAITFIYCGFAVPGADGLNHHLSPQSDPELFAALLITAGCASKLMGHVMLFSTARARAR